MFAISDYVASVRSLIWDNATSKIIKPDDLTQQVAQGDGRNSFMFSNQNIVTANMPGQNSPMLFSSDGAAFTGTGLTLTDAFNGFFTLTASPAKSLRVIYYFQFFQDSDIQTFVFNGLRQIGIDPTSASAYGNVPQQLFQAPCYLAAAEALKANAQLYVKFYNITIGGKGIQKGDKFKNIQAQAAAYEKTARDIRADYYTIQDRGKRPAASTRGAGTRTAPCYPGDAFQPHR